VTWLGISFGIGEGVWVSAKVIGGSLGKGGGFVVEDAKNILAKFNKETA